jgi:uncharacterized membrane-anchored protein
VPLLPPDHPERFVLAEEVHARPPEAVEAPARVTYVALLVDADDRERERTHLAALCERYAVIPPGSGATHFSARLGTVKLKWEKHGEFSSYTFFQKGVEEVPFSEPASTALPANWLSGLPGRTVVGAHACFMRCGDQKPGADELAQHFDGNTPVGAVIGGGVGYAFTDFRIHDDGCSRFAVYDRGFSPLGGFSPHQAGRMLQRLFEIEAYRMMALLALPVARRMSPRMIAIERSLATLTDGIARDDGADEQLLQELTRLAAEVESGLAATQFRFGACRAYHELVVTRIHELREERIPGIQTIEEFMARRLTPAVNTCATVSQRLTNLSDRVAQASGLLSTRVDIARERQNQALLSSMDRRAKLQLRLQQTVEGLSVAAIAYYVASLVGYLAKGLKAAGVPVHPDLATAITIPVVAITGLWAVRKVRRRAHDDEAHLT